MPLADPRSAPPKSALRLAGPPAEPFGRAATKVPPPPKCGTDSLRGTGCGEGVPNPGTESWRRSGGEALLPGDAASPAAGAASTACARLNRSSHVMQVYICVHRLLRMCYWSISTTEKHPIQ